MFTLTYRDGAPVLMRSGKPFVYTSRVLARIAQRLLSKELGQHLNVSALSA